MFLAENRKFMLSRHLPTLRSYTWSLDQNELPVDGRFAMVQLAKRTLSLTFGKFLDQHDDRFNHFNTLAMLGKVMGDRRARTGRIWRRLKRSFDCVADYDGLAQELGWKKDRMAYLDQFMDRKFWMMVRQWVETELEVCWRMADDTTFLDKE